MLTLTSSGFSAAAAVPPKPFQQILGWPGEEYRRPVAGAGGPYGVDSHAPTGTEPRTTLDITCTILVYNAGCETLVDEKIFRTFCWYIKHNIERTWSTLGNNYLSKDYLATCNITIQRVYDNRGTLKDGELFIAIKPGEGRSFIEGDRRAGIFYVSEARRRRLEGVYKTLIAGKKPTAANQAKVEAAFDNFGNTTPAHEFGHVLGLTDRYAYVGYVVDPGTSGDPPKVIIDRGHTLSLYVHTGDSEYSKLFGWLFNLMSTQQSPVASGSTLPAKFWDSHDPERDAGVTVHKGQAYALQFPSTMGPSRTSDIGITAAQLASVANQAQERIPGSSLVYFKKITAAQYSGPPGKYVFKGTFVGIVPDANGNALEIVHDDHYDLNRNTATIATSSWNTQHDLHPVDDEMEYRCCVIASTWNGFDPQTKASGFVGAALDIGGTVSKFMAETEYGGIAVPARLTELMDIVNLDARVTIRRFVGDYVQSCLDGSGALTIAQAAPKVAGTTTTGPPPPPIRYLDHLSLDEIRNTDNVFTPKTDLFATNADVLPDYPGIDQRGLLVPYDYPGRNTFRKGATLFHFGPPPAKVGWPIQVVPGHLLAAFGSSPANPAAIAGWIYGTKPVEIAYAQSIWNAYETSPSMNQFWKYKTKYIMDYEAPMHVNRSKIIALHKNGALRENGTKVVNNTTMIDRTRLDPTNWMVTRCFSARAVRYIGLNFKSNSSSNTNTLGDYLYIKRIL